MVHNLDIRRLHWVGAPSTGSSLAPLFTFADIKGRISERLTLKELSLRATEIASALLGKYGLVPGDRVILAHPPGIEFIAAFTACLTSGLIAVPVYPPDPMGPPSRITALAGIVEDTDARVALSSQRYLRLRSLGRLRSFWSRQGWPDKLTWVASDRLRSCNTAPTVPTPAADAPALNQ